MTCDVISGGLTNGTLQRTTLRDQFISADASGPRRLTWHAAWQPPMVTSQAGGSSSVLLTSFLSSTERDPPAGGSSSVLLTSFLPSTERGPLAGGSSSVLIMTSFLPSTERGPPARWIQFGTYCDVIRE